MAREYRRSVLIYLASRKYGLADLEALARKYIQRFGDELSLPVMLKETKDLFLTLPEDEDWFPSYVKEKLQQMLKPTEPGFNLNEFYNCIDQDKNFGVFVLKMAVEILFDHLPLWERISEYGKCHFADPKFCDLKLTESCRHHNKTRASCC